MSEELKIVSLEVSNVKRLKAVRVEPNGEAVVTVCGRNGAGKSSLLDAIEMAFAGKAAVPPRPVRDGADSGRIAIDLGDYQVTRTFDAGGKSSLEVRNADGARFPSPQALLERFVGEISFDPLAFSRMPPKQQAELLQKLTGLDLTGLDAEHAAKYAERTDVNREGKALAARVDGMEAFDAPNEEVSVSQLAERMAAAERRAAAIREREAEEKTLGSQYVQIGLDIIECGARLARLKGEAKAMKAQRTELLVQELPEPEDIDGLQEELAAAETTNQQVRANVARVTELAALEKKRETSKVLSDQLKAIEAKKQAAIEAADLPVPGLVFGAEGVTLNGIPFEQLATSEQIRASVAIGLAMNPKLRVMLVRDGSLLDEAGKELIREMAEAADAQVWMECVGTSGKVSVLIEDGEVVEAQ